MHAPFEAGSVGVEASTKIRAPAYPGAIDVTNGLVLPVDFSLKRTVWVVFGWHGEAALLGLLDAISGCSKVVVMINPAVDPVEPDFSDTFDAFAKRNAWDFKRVAVVSSEDAATLAALADAEIDRDLFDQWKPVIIQRYAEMHVAHVAEVIHAIAKIFNTSNLEKSTRKQITGYFVKNLLLNFATISTRYALADIQNKLKDRPAVLIAAGPSLNKQLPTLQKYQHLLTLIAVDSVWSVLKQHKITPDVVVALDALNVPAWTKNEFDSRSLLALDVGCNQEMFGSVATPMLVTSNHPTEASLCAALGAPVDTFPSGGSVATTAFNLAIWMGANPVIFVGQDLAYTDGKDHAEGYQYADAYDSGLREDRAHLGFDVEGYYGSRLRTERQFLHYKNWFERRIKQLDSATLVINCTEGGARIEGTARIPLLAVCEEISSVFNSKPPFHASPASRNEHLPVEARCEAIQHLIKRLTEFGQIAREGLQIVKNSNTKTLTKTLRKVDRVNAQLQSGDATIKYLVDTFAADGLEQVRRTTVRDERTDDTDRISLERYREIYESIEGAVKVLQPSLERLLTYIEESCRDKSTPDPERAKWVWSTS